MKIPSRFQSFDGTRIAYRLWGEPSVLTPVICCSGIACDDAYWTYLGPELSRDRQVVTWDYPWHGDSGPPGDRDQITVESLSRHAHEVLLRAGIERAAFIGHSMGVQVILEHFRMFPGDVAALIPIAGPYARTVGYLYGTNIGHYVLMLLQTAARSQPDLTSLTWRALADPRFADPLGRVLGLIGPAPVEIMERYFHHLATLDVGGLFDMFRAGQDHSAEDILEKIDVPVLIIHGTADLMSPFVIAEQMAERIPGAELLRMDGGAHTLPVEDPATINRAITEFLEERVDPQTEGRSEPES